MVGEGGFLPRTRSGVKMVQFEVSYLGLGIAIDSGV